MGNEVEVYIYIYIDLACFAGFLFDADDQPKGLILIAIMMSEKD
jgi:hypothetical protein